MNRRRKLREEAGLTREAAARLIGVPTLRLSRFEEGEQVLSRSQCIKLARVYGVSFSVLSELTHFNESPADTRGWYMIKNQNRITAYHSDQPPLEGSLALVQRGGELVEKLLTAQDLSTERVVAVAVQTSKELK